MMARMPSFNSLDPRLLVRRVTALPATIQTSTRARIAGSLEKLRIALDLPSRSELSELTTRLEALDARIAGMAATRAVEMGRPIGTLAAAETAAGAETGTETAAEPAAEPAAETAAAAAAETETETETDAAAETETDSKKKPRKNRR